VVARPQALVALPVTPLVALPVALPVALHHKLQWMEAASF